MPTFKIKFSEVTILQRVEFFIFVDFRMCLTTVQRYINVQCALNCIHDIIFVLNDADANLQAYKDLVCFMMSASSDKLDKLAQIFLAFVIGQ